MIQTFKVFFGFLNNFLKCLIEILAHKIEGGAHLQEKERENGFFYKKTGKERNINTKIEKPQLALSIEGVC